jgi:hypothetical protein
MDTHKLTGIAVDCASSHVLLLEAIRLREKLLSKLEEITAALERPLAQSPTAFGWYVNRQLGLRFDRLYGTLSAVEARVMRRRLRWLELQRDVFLQIGLEARGSTAEDAAGAADRLREALSLAALRSLGGRS